MKRIGVVLAVAATFGATPALAAAGKAVQLRPQLSVQTTEPALAKPSLVRPAFAKPALVEASLARPPRARAARSSVLRALAR